VATSTILAASEFPLGKMLDFSSSSKLSESLKSDMFCLLMGGLKLLCTPLGPGCGEGLLGQGALCTVQTGGAGGLLMLAAIKGRRTGMALTGGASGLLMLAAGRRSMICGAQTGGASGLLMLAAGRRSMICGALTGGTGGRQGKTDRDGADRWRRLPADVGCQQERHALHSADRRRRRTDDRRWRQVGHALHSADRRRRRTADVGCRQERHALHSADRRRRLHSLVGSLLRSPGGRGTAHQSSGSVRRKDSRMFVCVNLKINLNKTLQLQAAIRRFF
jgi:hypothetical protein